MDIDSNSHVPIYEQIVDSVRAGIAAGIYRPGEMLPSLRTMALELVVNPNTVQRAYEVLEREGIVYSRRGIGLFVTKQGVASSRAKSKSALLANLSGNIASARSAGLTDESIRAAFEKALNRTAQQTRSKT